MVQLGPAAELRALADLRRKDPLALASSQAIRSSTGPQAPPPLFDSAPSPHEQPGLPHVMPAVANDAPPRLMSGVASPPNRAALQAIQFTNAAAKLAVQQRLGPDSSGHPGSAAAATAAAAEEEAAEAKEAAASISAAASAGSTTGAAAFTSGVVADEEGALRGLSLDALSAVVAQRTKAVRALKAAKKVFEVDPEAKAAAKALQEA